MKDAVSSIVRKSLERGGMIVILGAGLYFSWLDSLFAGKLFPLHRGGVESEVGALLVFALSACMAAIAFFRSSWMQQLICRNDVAFYSALAGAVGSGLLVAFDSLESPVLLVGGALLGGWFMTYFQFCWCAAFCKEGAKTAIPFVTGSIALSVLLDSAPLLMTPMAAAAVFSLLPLASFAAFRAEDPSFRLFNEASLDAPRLPGRPLGLWKSLAGVSAILLAAFSLMFVCFGYLQHLMSFSPSVEVETAIIVLGVRGAAALALFVALVIAKCRPSVAYRIGLVALIGGCMGSSLVSGPESWVMYCIIMAGFTVFNVLFYVAFSQVAYTESADPCKTIGMMWIINGAGVALGGALGMYMEHFHSASFGSSPQVPIAIGYLVAIASVLFLSSEDIWVVLGLSRKEGPHPGDRELGERLREEGLTARESEIALLLEQGRTQAWIAGSLVISESTVATHVRHIYRKLNVHNRQQFLDYCRSEAVSSKTDDRDSGLT